MINPYTICWNIFGQHTRQSATQWHEKKAFTHLSIFFLKQMLCFQCTFLLSTCKDLKNAKINGFCKVPIYPILKQIYISFQFWPKRIKATYVMSYLVIHTRNSELISMLLQLPSQLHLQNELHCCIHSSDQYIQERGWSCPKNWKA